MGQASRNKKNCLSGEQIGKRTFFDRRVRAMVLRQLFHARPGFGCGCAEHFEYELQLLWDRRAGEKRLSARRHLCKGGKQPRAVIREARQRQGIGKANQHSIAWLWDQTELGVLTGQDAAGGPNVNGCVVIVGAEQDVGRSVPQRNDFVRVALDGNASWSG